MRAKEMRTTSILAAAVICVAGCSDRIDVLRGAGVNYENRFTGLRVVVRGALADEIIAVLNAKPVRAERNVSTSLDTMKYLSVGTHSFQVAEDSLILIDDWGVRFWEIKDIEARLDAPAVHPPAKPDAGDG